MLSVLHADVTGSEDNGWWEKLRTTLRPQLTLTVSLRHWEQGGRSWGVGGEAARASGGQLRPFTPLPPSLSGSRLTPANCGTVYLNWSFLFTLFCALIDPSVLSILSFNQVRALKLSWIRQMIRQISTQSNLISLYIKSQTTLILLFFLNLPKVPVADCQCPWAARSAGHLATVFSSVAKNKFFFPPKSLVNRHCWRPVSKYKNMES